MLLVFYVASSRRRILPTAARDLSLFFIFQLLCSLLCTEDDNSCYRNVCKMSVVSFALAVVFITSCCGLRGWKSTTLSYRFVFLPTNIFFTWVCIVSRALEGVWLSLCFFR